MTLSPQNDSGRHVDELRGQRPPEAPNFSAQQLFLNVKRAIIEATESQDLEFENVDPHSGAFIARSLCENPEVERHRPRVHYNSVTQVLWIRIMPTALHDCQQLWLKNEMRPMLTGGFLNEDEYDHLGVWVGTTFTGFRPPYTFSSKEPDLAIRPGAIALPTVVIETVQLVLLVKWSRLSGDLVKGFVEVWSRDSTGTPNLLQTETIFPLPMTPSMISISRGQLFGSTVFSGRNTTDSYQLSIARLGDIAMPWIQGLGCTPAQEEN
ncbi:hypothetical protein AJ78_00698 [Emergomyces pasteurianus Ep9510]|uniref:Uncharacterized protein n=1 Tax=Emergomyces pasteurianus Ep9510 TaxID=1447872 RepID=A0A1J9PSD4_9EURO|nr:hypothetical protein AJ78_00698 [Emergomyces pasteurianus Ep9510]